METHGRGLLSMSTAHTHSQNSRCPFEKGLLAAWGNSSWIHASQSSTRLTSWRRYWKYASCSSGLATARRSAGMTVTPSSSRRRSRASLIRPILDGRLDGDFDLAVGDDRVPGL